MYAQRQPAVASGLVASEQRTMTEANPQRFRIFYLLFLGKSRQIICLPKWRAHMAYHFPSSARENATRSTISVKTFCLRESVGRRDYMHVHVFSWNRVRTSRAPAFYEWPTQLQAGILVWLVCFGHCFRSVANFGSEGNLVLYKVFQLKSCFLIVTVMVLISIN